MIFRKCPECGAYLDPGEVCDCEKERGAGDDNRGRIQGFSRDDIVEDKAK